MNRFSGPSFRRADAACYRLKDGVARVDLVAYLWSTSAFAAQPFGVDLAAVPSIGLRLPDRGRLCCSSPPRIARSPTAMFPEIERLDREFAPAGVRFWWVYPIPRTHRKWFAAINSSSIFAATRCSTPNSASPPWHTRPLLRKLPSLFPRKDTLREVYRGRIDDRYLSLGQERPSADKHELEIALRALTANRPVPAPGGPPVGCSIVPRSEP